MEGEKSFACQGLLQPMCDRPALLQGAHRWICQLKEKPQRPSQTLASGPELLVTANSHMTLKLTPPRPTCVASSSLLPWTLHAIAESFILSCLCAGLGCYSQLRAERQNTGVEQEGAELHALLWWWCLSLTRGPSGPSSGLLLGAVVYSGSSVTAQAHSAPAICPKLAW